MPIVGFELRKITGEKIDNLSDKLEISYDYKIDNIVKKDLPFLTNNEEGISVMFNFLFNYKPNIGKIEVIGDIIYIGKKEEIKTILDGWKEKKINAKFMEYLLSNILTRSISHGVMLSKELNLPMPIALPKLSPTENKK